jgi:hypothetical protein
VWRGDVIGTVALCWREGQLRAASTAVARQTRAADEEVAANGYVNDRWASCLYHERLRLRRLRADFRFHTMPERQKKRESHWRRDGRRGAAGVAVDFDAHRDMHQLHRVASEDGLRCIAAEGENCVYCPSCVQTSLAALTSMDAGSVWRFDSIVCPHFVAMRGAEPLGGAANTPASAPTTTAAAVLMEAITGAWAPTHQHGAALMPLLWPEAAVALAAGQPHTLADAHVTPVIAKTLLMRRSLHPAELYAVAVAYAQSCRHRP